MLKIFIGISVLCTTAFAALSSTLTPSTTTKQETTEKPLDIFDSAIFQCGNYLYQDSLSMLFPPCDKSLPFINSTRAKIVHTESYTHFCEKIDTYKACVQLLVNRSFSPVDDLLKHYVDLENFPKAMGEFCSNKTLVTDNFMCTKNHSEFNSCPDGGIYGIMSYVEMAVKNRLHKKQYCEDFQSSIRCRVDQQLMPCNTKYAKLMEGVYTKLIQNIC